MKNIDKLRSMTTEQLAAQICDWLWLCEDCPGKDLCEYNRKEGGTAIGLTRWLNQEAEEKADGD